MTEFTKARAMMTIQQQPYYKTSREWWGRSVPDLASWWAKEMLKHAKPLLILNNPKQRIRRQLFFHGGQVFPNLAGDTVKFRRPVPYESTEELKKHYEQEWPENGYTVTSRMTRPMSYKTRLCETTGKPLYLCEFKDVGEAAESEYNPGSESGSQQCTRCGMLRFYTRETTAVREARYDYEEKSFQEEDHY